MSSVLLLLLQQVSCSLVSENGDVLQFAVLTWNVADDALGVEIQPQNLVVVLSSQWKCWWWCHMDWNLASENVIDGATWTEI